MAFALGARAACLSVPVNAALSRQRRRRPGLSLGRSSKPLVRASVGGEPPSGPRMEESSGSEGPSTALQTREPLLPFQLQEEEGQRSAVQSILYPDPSQLPDEVNMTIWEHLEELRERALVSFGSVAALILVAFCFSKDLVIFLEQPVASTGVRFIAAAPGEFFFTTVKVAGYAGLLIGAPVVLYEIIAFVLPGLTRQERQFLGPIVLGSSVLFYAGLTFSYSVLTPAALNFFVSYNDQAVESLWSIDQYFEFVLVLMLSTGLSFQVPVIQLLLGGLGLVSSTQMFSIWKYVVVGATVAAAVLTPSTDPLTQGLLALPLMGLYFGGAGVLSVYESAQGRGPLSASKEE